MNTNKKDGSCRNKDNFPLDGKFLVECIVCEPTVSTTYQTKTYFASAEGDFQSRYNNHTLSFRSKRYQYRLDFSNTEFCLKWRIKAKAVPYKCGSPKCDLCLASDSSI